MLQCHIKSGLKVIVKGLAGIGRGITPISELYSVVINDYLVGIRPKEGWARQSFDLLVWQSP